MRVTGETLPVRDASHYIESLEL